MFEFLKRKPQEQKSYPAASYLFNNTGIKQYTKYPYTSLAREGYEMNAIAFRCIYMIKQAVGDLSCKLVMEDEDGQPQKVESHPALNLLYSPNPMQGKEEFISELTAYYLIAGNSYVYNPNELNEPRQLYTLSPDDVEVISGTSMPEAYEVRGLKRRFPVDKLTGKSAVMQIKDFNATDPWYGMSRLQAAVYAIDSFNESQKWNYNLLKNGAKPDGILSAKDDMMTSTEQISEVLEQIERSWNGANNAGGTKFIGSFDWKQMSMSPKDMDFKDSQVMAARYISQIFGVPPQMIGLPEAQTFSNMEMAKLDFYENTVIPIANVIYSALNRWLFQFYKEEGLYFCIDMDKISALDPQRKEKSERFARLVDSGILSINEAREAMGYQPIDGMDELLINSNKIPVSAASDIEDETEKSLLDEINLEAIELFETKAEGDEINSFGDSKFPAKPSFSFINDIKENYPEMWRKVGNGGSGEDRTSFTGKDAFRLWSAYKDGDRSEKVTNWLKRRESFVARFRNNVSNWQGMLALGMWAGVPSQGGFDRMKKVLNEQKAKVRESR